MGMFARMFGGFSSGKTAEARLERRDGRQRRNAIERRMYGREFDIDRRSSLDRRLGIDWRGWA